MTAISCLDDGAGHSTAGDDDHASFLRSCCRSRLHGWMPMAVDGMSAPGAQEFSPAAPPVSGAPIGIPRAHAFGAKIRGFGRGAALRLPSARVSRAPALFRLPGHYGVSDPDSSDRGF